MALGTRLRLGMHVNGPERHIISSKGFAGTALARRPFSNASAERRGSRRLRALQRRCVFQRPFGQLPQNGSVHEVELLMAICCIKPNDADTLIPRMRPICVALQNLALHINFFSSFMVTIPSDSKFEPQMSGLKRSPLFCSTKTKRS